MTKQEIEFIKTYKRWPIKFTDIFERYFIVFFPLCLLFIGAMPIWFGILRNNYIDVLFGIPIFIFGIFFFVFTLRRLIQAQKFETFILPNVSNEIIENAFKKANLDNYKYHRKGYFSCSIGISLFSWGEDLTVILNGNEMLLNCRSNRQPITVFKYRKKVKEFINLLC